MKKQKVIVRPPVLQIKFGRFRLEAKGVAGEVDNIEELRELVQKPFHDLFEDLNKLLQERLEVSILTEGGNEVGNGDWMRTAGASGAITSGRRRTAMTDAAKLLRPIYALAWLSGGAPHVPGSAWHWGWQAH